MTRNTKAPSPASQLLAALLNGNVEHFNTLRRQHPEVQSIGKAGRGKRLANKTLDGINLAGLTTWLKAIKNVTFIDSNLEGWTLEAAELTKVRFKSCRLRSGSWANCDLLECTFMHSKLGGRMVFNTTFDRCVFVETSIARLYGTRDARWEEVELDSEDQWLMLMRKLHPRIRISS